MATRTMLYGVALCQPFEQGDLDNLCGLYAALNAMFLVSAPKRLLNQTQAMKILTSGIDDLQRRNGLCDALVHGMTLRRQRAVTRHMAKAAKCVTGLGFAAKPLDCDMSKLTVDSTLDLLAGRIQAGSAVIASLENTFWHYTVISGVSRSRVNLFDSDGLHWIERRSLGICGSDPNKRHCISPGSLIEISVVST